MTTWEIHALVAAVSSAAVGWLLGFTAGRSVSRPSKPRHESRHPKPQYVVDAEDDAVAAARRVRLRHDLEVDRREDAR